MNFSVLDARGVVIRTGHAPQEDHHLQAGDGEQVISGDAPLGHRIDPVTGQAHAMPPPPSPPSPPLTVSQARAAHYPPIANQLDALWHAMDAGLLPRVPGFYDEIAAVKNALPKE